MNAKWIVIVVGATFVFLAGLGGTQDIKIQPQDENSNRPADAGPSTRTVNSSDQILIPASLLEGKESVQINFGSAGTRGYLSHNITTHDPAYRPDRPDNPANSDDCSALRARVAELQSYKDSAGERIRLLEAAKADLERQLAACKKSK